MYYVLGDMDYLEIELWSAQVVVRTLWINFDAVLGTRPQPLTLYLVLVV